MSEDHTVKGEQNCIGTICKEEQTNAENNRARSETRSCEAVGATLFIGDLSHNVTDAALLDAFSVYGAIAHIDVKRDRITGNCLGYGFVRFTNTCDAEKALRSLNGKKVCGRRIRIGWGKKSSKLYVFGLDQTPVSAPHVWEYLNSFGAIQREHSHVLFNLCFTVSYMRREDAEAAKLELDSKPGCRTFWADANTQLNCVYTQFMSDRPIEDPRITERMLFEVFAPFGYIEMVSLPRHIDGSLKGYGFVHFFGNELGHFHAVHAIHSLHNTSIFGITIHCSFGRKPTYLRRPSEHQAPVPLPPVPYMVPNQTAFFPGYTHPPLFVPPPSGSPNKNEALNK